MAILILALAFSACSERHRSVDPIEFNRKIAVRKDLGDPELLMKAYYNWPEEEGNPMLSISWTRNNDRVEVTLVHEGLEDDSQEGMKIVMVAEEKGLIWKVLEIRECWKCWPGRGHTDWGIEPCN